MKKENSILSKLGPGLLYAGAAIGVSHLVQSTRAGASFGIIMIVVVILANFFKYPFFQYGPRYAAATGKSLLHGYKKLGSWAIWIFFLPHHWNHVYYSRSRNNGYGWFGHFHYRLFFVNLVLDVDNFALSSGIISEWPNQSTG